MKRTKARCLTMVVVMVSFIKQVPAFQLWNTLRSSPTRSCFHSKSDDFLDNLGDLLDQQALKDKKEERHTQTDGWRRIDWKKQFWSRNPPKAQVHPSPVERTLVRNRLVYFKRDDLMKLSGGAPISGNKARKMVALNDISASDFPSAVVSYGGPQSNAMLALAAIVHFKNTEALALSQNSTINMNTDETSEVPPLKRFVYYTKKLPKFLRNQPNGNLFRAQTLGMELIELPAEEYRNLFGGEWGGPTEPPAIDPPLPGDSLWVPQGGACGMAIRGGWELADEIISFWSQNGNGRPLTVCIPGGTCSTAVLVNAALRDIQQEYDNTLDIRVVVIPCVGDENYARRQMMSLCRSIWGEGTSLEDKIPAVLSPLPDLRSYFGQSSSPDAGGYFSFGEPNADILATFREMDEEYGIALDLIYGAPCWTILLRHFRTEAMDTTSSANTATFDPNAPLAGREIMYVHSGGLEGVNSQLMRYKYKGLIEDVQLPGRR